MHPTTIQFTQKMTVEHMREKRYPLWYGST